MLQQLTISTNDRATLKPLVESALEHEKDMLSLATRRTRERLTGFEQQFGTSCAEFELQETVEFTDWRMEIGMLRLLKSQHQALREAKLV